jgi:cysteine desulfurase
MPVDADGVARLDWLAEALSDARPGGGLPSIMANNESGVIQPIAEASARLVRAAGGWLHVDAVQAAGKIAGRYHAPWAPTP